MSDFTKTYSNGEVTIVWKPDLCIHSTKCFRGLPEVFNPRVKPWIDPGASNTLTIVEQVAKCPSGALSIDRPEAPLEAAAIAAATIDRPVVTIQVQQGGPYIITGPVAVKLPDGTEVIHSAATTLCSCGKSGTMPACDCS